MKKIKLIKHSGQVVRCIYCRHFVARCSGCSNRIIGVDPIDGHEVAADAREERTSLLPWRCGPKGRHWATRLAGFEK